jgi:DNA-binding NarL/FixJ family response regulator
LKAAPNSHLSPGAEAHEIRLILVDDHILFREGLARLLEAEEGLLLVGHFSSVQQALADVDLATIDVALLDFDLGEHQGMQFLREAPVYGFRGRVLMVTAGMSNLDAQNAMENGASGIFLKHSAPNSLIAAIRQVAAGRPWPDVNNIEVTAASSANAVPARTPLASRPTLSRREQQVLRGVFEGLTNKEIGAQLEISESYVKAVLQQLFAKAGVRTRSQLVRVALEKRLE